MKKTILLALATAALAAPAIAEDHGHKHDAAHAAMHKAHQERMAKILADPSRAEDAKRDKYRHPAETFEFFRIHPNHVVGEYAPGGEWISRTLGRYMEGSGKFNGLFFSTTVFADEKTREGVKAGAAKFADDVAKVTGKPASDYRAFTLDAVPDGAKGTFDRIIVMRMIHNLMRWNMADQEIKRMRDLLKDDGLLGIEQHRAKADAPFSYADGSKGYVREADVIKFMEVNGFELVAKSEINANPKDSANWPDGVWTLPPVRRFDKENDAKYQAIGESDRMTLLFKKRP
ncbi:class I SAM-dependent methyltransferase [Sphingorhabdus sp.]|jgi:predicted methyltransferase|uniref:class I SAM-dependent methyltransferase n=2 Tax=Sphingorhabdus sp. TaxID=1902408 RepID=UPI003BB088E9|nr:class I SAM-dependent methyltransferase [Sphingomonadales bacterium]MBL0021705.1 class I SAM-dependent methyltransferase [Sphingomonadales bacterium]